jgi:hypothetical protein
MKSGTCCYICRNPVVCMLLTHTAAGTNTAHILECPWCVVMVVPCVMRPERAAILLQHEASLR